MCVNFINQLSCIINKITITEDIGSSHGKNLSKLERKSHGNSSYRISWQNYQDQYKDPLTNLIPRSRLESSLTAVLWFAATWIRSETCGSTSFSLPPFFTVHLPKVVPLPNCYHQRWTWNKVICFMDMDWSITLTADLKMSLSFRVWVSLLGRVVSSLLC